MIRKVTAIFMSLLLIWAGVPLGAATAAVNPPQQVNVETFGEKVKVDGKQSR